MMSQSRSRKAPTAGDAGRSRPVTKASGDVTKEPKEPSNTQQHHRIKNRIPKSIRYDLENALVGLCDVWFEDIKPYLLRNNIRLHVHGGGGPGGADEAAAGGDRGRPPPGAPGCSHIDPGAATDSLRQRIASSAGCFSARPATLRTRSRKLRKPPFKPLSPLLSPAPTITSIPENPKNSDENIVPSLQAGHPPSATSSSTKTSTMPGLNHSYNLYPPLSPHTLKQYCDRSSPRKSLEVYITSPRVKDQCTQTEATRSRRRCQQRPQQVQSPKGNNAKSKSPTRRRKSPSPTRRRKSPSPTRTQKSFSPVRRQKSPGHIVKQQSPKFQRQSNSSSLQCQFAANPPVRRQKSSLPSVPAPSVLPSHNREYCYDQRLCRDDLYHRVGASYDTYLKYDSPRREESPATMNNISCPEKKERGKVLPPWR